MPTSSADIHSNTPARLLRWLCNHWRHKFEITHDHDGHALIPLGEVGTAEFNVGEGVLHAKASHPEAGQLPHLREVIENHLERFARDETLSFDWQTQGQVQPSPD